MPVLERSSEMDLVAKLRAQVSGCRVCKGYGHVLKGSKMAMCECKAEAEFQYRLAMSDIPPRFRKKGFDDYLYKQGQAYAKIQDYLRNADQHRLEGVGLYLSGPSYTGKSLLSCSLIIELMRRGYDCKYMAFDGILDKKYDLDKEAIDQKWDFLVLGKVGDVLSRLSNFRETMLTGESTHGAVEFLTGLISARMNAGRPIIIPSRVPLQDLNAKFPSLADTLLGSCIHVLCEDKGFRQKRIELMMDQEG